MTVTKLLIEESILNRDLNPGLLATGLPSERLTSELLRPDILTDSQTPGYQMTYMYSLSLGEKCMKHILGEYLIVVIYIGHQMSQVLEPCLNWDSKPGPLAYCKSTLTTELLRPDMFTELL